MFQKGQIGKRVELAHSVGYINMFVQMRQGVYAEGRASGLVFVLDENAYVIIGHTYKYIVDGFLVGERAGFSREYALGVIEHLRNGTLPDQVSDTNAYYSVGRMANMLKKGKLYRQNAAQAA